MYKFYLLFKAGSCNLMYELSSLIKTWIISRTIIGLLLTFLVAVSVILITFPEETNLVIRRLFCKNIYPGKQYKFWIRLIRLIGITIMFISCTLIFYLISNYPMPM